MAACLLCAWGNWGNVNLFLAPVLLDEDSLHGRSHKVDCSHANKKVANWPSQAGDGRSKFESEFVINHSLDYDFLREKCCIHHIYKCTRSPGIEGWLWLVAGWSCVWSWVYSSNDAPTLIPVPSPQSAILRRNHRDATLESCSIVKTTTRNINTWRCLNGRLISLDSTMCGSSHRLQSATLPSIVCAPFPQTCAATSTNDAVANPQTSRSIGIGWPSPIACP